MNTVKTRTTVQTFDPDGRIYDTVVKDRVYCSFEPKEEHEFRLILGDRFNPDDVTVFLGRLAYLVHEYKEIDSNAALMDKLHLHQGHVNKMMSRIEFFNDKPVFQTHRVTGSCKFPAREPDEHMKQLTLHDKAVKALAALREYEDAMAEYLSLEPCKNGRPKADKHDLMFQVGVIWLDIFKEVPPYSYEGVFHRSLNMVAEVAGHPPVSMRAVRDVINRMR